MDTIACSGWLRVRKANGAAGEAHVTIEFDWTCPYQDEASSVNDQMRHCNHDISARAQQAQLGAAGAVELQGCWRRCTRGSHPLAS